MSETKKIVIQQNNGTDYDKLYPQVDSYSKNETLTNNTSQMFRIDNGTPEDVFKWLRKYNQHEWKRSNFSIQQNIKLSSLAKNLASTHSQIYYSKEILVENNNYTRLKNPLFLDSSVDVIVKILAESAPCYIQYFWGNGNTLATTTNAIFYIPNGATYGTNTDTTLQYHLGSDEDHWWLNSDVSIPVQLVTGVLNEQKSIEWLYNSDENFYPKTLTTKDETLSLILNNKQTYSISGLSEITYSDTCSFNNPNIWLGDSTTININSTNKNVNAIKNKYVHFSTKYSTSLLAKSVFVIPDTGQNLIANINAAFHFGGQIVDFTRNQQTYYTLEYKGIPFENLKELTV